MLCSGVVGGPLLFLFFLKCAGARRLPWFRRRWWTLGPGVGDSVSLTEIGQNSDTSDWVGWQCVYKSAEGFVLSYVNQTLDFLCTGRRNQTICGFRGNADVGVAALSCYSALRQHGMSESLRPLPIWRWVTVPVQYNGMTTLWWCQLEDCWCFALNLTVHVCYQKRVRAYSHQRRAFFLLRKFCCGYINGMYGILIYPQQNFRSRKNAPLWCE